MLLRHLDLNTTTPLIESVSFNLSFLGNSVSLTDTLASRHPHTWLEISFYRNTAKLAHDTNAPHSHRIQLKRHTKRENHSKAPLSPLFPGDSHACSWLSPRGKDGGARGGEGTHYSTSINLIFTYTPPSESYGEGGWAFSGRFFCFLPAHRGINPPTKKQRPVGA